MKVIKIFFFICLAIILQACSLLQPKPYGNTKEPVKVYDNWQKIIVPNIGTFAIPPTLEIESEEHKKKRENNPAYSMPTNLSYIEAGNKGYSDMESWTPTKFARVYLLTVPASKEGKPLTLRTSIVDGVNINLKDFDSVRFGNEDVNKKWPSKVLHVSGIDCIYSHYVKKQPALNMQLVETHEYAFYNNSKMHLLTIQYLEEDDAYWQSEPNNLTNIVQTLDLIIQ